MTVYEIESRWLRRQWVWWQSDAFRQMIQYRVKLMGCYQLNQCIVVCYPLDEIEFGRRAWASKIFCRWLKIEQRLWAKTNLLKKCNNKNVIQCDHKKMCQFLPKNCWTCQRWLAETQRAIWVFWWFMQMQQCVDGTSCCGREKKDAVL